MNNIVHNFQEVTGMTVPDYPTIDIMTYNIRHDNKKLFGEVFTPFAIVDKMLETSKPISTKKNIDLCAGHGQFTIRMLMKFKKENKEFNVQEYLKTKHWFNEYNTESAKDIVYIFGTEINLAIGPAEKLNEYPVDNNEWKKGIFCYNENLKSWKKILPENIGKKKATNINKFFNF